MPRPRTLAACLLLAFILPAVTRTRCQYHTKLSGASPDIFFSYLKFLSYPLAFISADSRSCFPAQSYITMWQNTSSSSPSSPANAQNRPVSSAPSYRLKNQGRRVAQIVKLKPECVEQYKECHRRVWPEVLKQIKHCNIEDCESPFSFSQI